MESTFCPTQNQLLGILYVEVDLTIFEEPVGFEGVCVGIQRFVVKYRPFRYSIGYRESGSEMGCVPWVIKDRRTSGDEPSLVHIVLHQSTWRP